MVRAWHKTTKNDCLTRDTNKIMLVANKVAYNITHKNEDDEYNEAKTNKNLLKSCVSYFSVFFFFFLLLYYFLFYYYICYCCCDDDDTA